MCTKMFRGCKHAETSTVVFNEDLNIAKLSRDIIWRDRLYRGVHVNQFLNVCWRQATESLEGD